MILPHSIADLLVMRFSRNPLQTEIRLPSSHSYQIGEEHANQYTLSHCNPLQIHPCYSDYNYNRLPSIF